MTTTARRTKHPTYPAGASHGPRADRVLAGWALTGDAWLPGVRLIRAEFLKLTRRRALMFAAAVLTAAAVIASDLVRTGVLPGAGYALMAILLGGCAGAADVTAGVFRGLVSTGRSPVALFLARIPAGLALSVGFTLAGYLVAAAGSALLAGHPVAPPGGLLVSACAGFLLGLGLGSLGARIWRHGQPGRLAPGAVRHWGVARDLAWRCCAKYALDRRSHKNTITVRPTPHSAAPMIQVGPVTTPWA